MTSLNLILLIAGVAGLQLAIYLGVAFWRHWLEYLALRRRAANEVPEPVEEPAAGVTSSGAAWAGLRSFRVARKVAEDAAGTVSSFYLVPEDGRPPPPYRAGQFLTFSLDIPAASGGTGQADPLLHPLRRASSRRIPDFGQARGGRQSVELPA